MTNDITPEDYTGIQFIKDGVSTFIELTDCPSAYTGESGKYVRVKSTEDGLEFATVSSSSLLNVIEVAGATHSVDNGEDYLSVTYTDTGAVTITIPTAQNEEGRIITIADDGFNSYNNNITITAEDAGTKINNSTNDYIIGINGVCIRLLCFNGTDWRVL